MTAPAHVQNVLSRLEKVNPSGNGWEACCPAHEDKNPSLSINVGDDGGVMLHCHRGCDQEAVRTALNIEWREMWPQNGISEPDRIYQYHYATGQEAYQVVRLPGKKFRARHMNGAGWVWNLKGVDRVLYRYPGVVKAIDQGDLVLITEGEKDADNARTKLGLAATTNTFGAGKWKGCYSASLKGGRIAIIPDNDKPGIEHAQTVAASLSGLAESVKIVKLPDLKEKGDLTDWVDAGGTQDELLRLYEAAPEYAVEDISEAKDGRFWREDGTKVKIDKDALLLFLQATGFAKTYLNDQDTSTLVRIQDRIVEQVSAEKVKDHVLAYVDNLPDTLEDGASRDDLRKALQNTAHIHLSPSGLELLRPIELDLIRPTRDTAYFFYRNGVATVTATSIKLVPYASIGGCIWRSQIIDRDYIVTGDQRAVFATFLANTCDNDVDRRKALQTAIGNTLHAYKDPARAKAMILVDEKVSDVPSGRSGKTIVAKAISHVVPTVIEDAKQFSFRTQFAFQAVRHDTRVLVFDDATAKFPFERLFSMITGPMAVERKNKQKIHIAFEDAPKILITSNFMIQGEGGSFEDRVFEVEFSQHYNEHRKPEHEFGCRFFDEWDSAEWARFDRMMMGCVQTFLKDGLHTYEHVNLKERKLRQLTSAEFAEWVLDDPPEIGKKYMKADLFSAFKKDYPEIDDASQSGCTRWLTSWARLEDLETTTGKSGSDRWIKFERLS